MDSATPVDTSPQREGPEPVTAHAADKKIERAGEKIEPAGEKTEPAEEKVTAQDAGLIKPPSPTPLVRVSGFCLVTLTVLAVLFGLKAGQEFIVPVVMAIVVAYTLDPVVALFERYRVPRWLGTVLVMSAIAIGIVGVIYVTQDQVADIINALPEISSKLSRTLGGLLSGDGSLMEKLRNAASILQESGTPKPSGRVVVAKSDGGLSDILLWGSKGLATFVGQATMCVFLVFFLLLSGNAFKRKFVKMAGKTLSQKKISVHMLDQINNSIHMYMAMMLVTNVVLGLLSWAAFRMLGLENAATWAVVAGALHIIPYFGPLMTAVGTAIAGLIQFGELGPALAVSMSSVAIALLMGVVVTTWMSGRIARMNAVAVFILLLLFTWLWGIWGTLLSVPIAFIAKVVADHIEGLEALSEFLSE
ncbi:AI-2E family transporter [Achromobacter sp.]|uniref:AI-2E family transporter n=1 Tax=Achromobacter sp. TaxID=134375 RepID=UPI0028A28CE0|nr:AI-2E family transporter [Achromobacter sp.]